MGRPELDILPHLLVEQNHVPRQIGVLQQGDGDPVHRQGAFSIVEYTARLAYLQLMDVAEPCAHRFAWWITHDHPCQQRLRAVLVYASSGFII